MPVVLVAYKETEEDDVFSKVSMCHKDFKYMMTIAEIEES